MKRYGLLVLSLAMVCFWLIGSYLPLLTPMNISSLPISSSFLGWMASLCFVVFLVVQVWILFSTGSALGTQASMTRHRLHLSVELFWTFLPILITLLLAWGSWLSWQAQ